MSSGLPGLDKADEGLLLFNLYLDRPLLGEILSRDLLFSVDLLFLECLPRVEYFMNKQRFKLFESLHLQILRVELELRNL